MLLQNTKNTPSFAPTSVLYNGLRASTHWLYSTTWIDFCLFIALKVQLMLFVRHFMFFSAWGIHPHFIRVSVLRRILLPKGGSKASPFNPNTFYIQFHRLQKHENKKARNESNNGNPYAGANNYHLTKQHQAAVCLSAQHELRLLWLSLVIMWTPRGLRFCATFDTKSCPVRRT